jgi:thymidylate synthase
LCWFLHGCTDNKALNALGVKIWDANCSAAFLASRGLHYDEGDAGPIYGFQWRQWGATYRGKDADYTGEGIDQLAAAARLLREDRQSRRIKVTAWNPAVWQDCRLDPYNIASYAPLLIFMATVTHLTPGDLVVKVEDAHVYVGHFDNRRKQVARAPE